MVGIGQRHRIITNGAAVSRRARKPPTFTVIRKIIRKQGPCPIRSKCRYALAFHKVENASSDYQEQQCDHSNNERNVWPFSTPGSLDVVSWRWLYWRLFFRCFLRDVEMGRQ